MLRENFENTTSLDCKRVTDMIDELLDESGLRNVYYEMENLYFSLNDVTGTSMKMYRWGLDHHLDYSLNGYKIRKDNNLKNLETIIDELGKEIQSV